MGNALAAFMLLYFVVVGWQGRALDAVNQVGEDASEFIPVFFAIIALLLLYNSRAKPLVSPFITLAVLTVFLTRFDNIKKDVQTSYKMLTSGVSDGGRFGGGATGEF